MRMMLPSWLGSDVALEEAFHNDRVPVLREMMQQWPFFKTYVDMLEMVLAKSDLRIASYYEKTLVDDPKLLELGKNLRERLQGCIRHLLELKQQDTLLEQEPVFAHSMRVRNPYTDPLHYLQAELLKRDREGEGKGEVPEMVERALKVTMAGIAAGMRNTG
jgi:phosphoenolpyruvate carboxylase